VERLDGFPDVGAEDVVRRDESQSAVEEGIVEEGREGGRVSGEIGWLSRYGRRGHRSLTQRREYRRRGNGRGREGGKVGGGRVSLDGGE